MDRSEAKLGPDAMPSEAPFFSVILCCRNPGPILAEALDSIWAQQGAAAEAVVIDGGSTDGTRSWLEARAGRLGSLLSEPDRSVYEAMNKGVRLARGHWLLFLGADDRLAGPEVLTEVRAAIDTTDEGLFSGEAAYSDGRIWPPPKRPEVRYRNFLHHQATFYHRSVFSRFHYDETLRIQADYDLNLRLWRIGIRPRPLPIRVTVCGSGGLSDAGRWANYREEIVVRHRYTPAWQCARWDTLSLLRFIRKKLIRHA